MYMKEKFIEWLKNRKRNNGEPYSKETISNYIKGEMKRMNKEEGGYFWVEKDETPVDVFEKIKPDQNFYINPNGELVICFDKYDVAAGAQGSPEFVIPKNVIKDILR